MSILCTIGLHKWENIPVKEPRICLHCLRCLIYKVYEKHYINLGYGWVVRWKSLIGEFKA